MFINEAWAQTAAPGGADLMSMLPIILMFVVLYFVMIRPQMKRAKEHKAMVEAIHNAVDELFHFHEIDQQADRVKLGAFNRQLHAVVVAVHVLAFAAVTAQGMSGGEGLFHGNFKH